MTPLCNGRLALAVALGFAGAASASAQNAAPGTWRVTAERRIGEDVPFGQISGLAATASGVFVLDAKAQEIRLFDVGNGTSKVVARKGSGPGEILNANGLTTTPDGSVLVNDPENSRIVILSARGAFVRQVEVPITSSDYTWLGVASDGATILEPSMALSARPDPQTGRPRNLRVARRITLADKPKIDTLSLPPCSLMTVPAKRSFQGSVRAPDGRVRSGFLSIPFLPLPTLVFDPAGFVWCAPRDAYHAFRFSPGRLDTLTTIRRATGPIPLSRDDRDSATATVLAFKVKWPTSDADPSLIPATKPPIEALLIDDRGQLWVKTPSTSATTSTFDVYDRNGRSIARATMAFRIDPTVRPVFDGDLVYVVAMDDDGVQTVVKARIAK